MAFLGSNVTSEVGLRLLLCPLGSNIVTRAACCSVGIVLPVYSTLRAIERNDENEKQKWLTYWAAYGSFTLVEAFSDKLLSWFPYYYHFKFAFLVWIQLPSIEVKFKIMFVFSFMLRARVKMKVLICLFLSRFFISSMLFFCLLFLNCFCCIFLQSTSGSKAFLFVGSKQIYKNHLRPFLLKYQARVDQLNRFAFAEMARFISVHQEEFQFVRTMFAKIRGSDDPKVRGATEPT